MAIKTAYQSKVGKDFKISDHFKLREMACKDGTDKVLYSTDLMRKLEQLRAYGGFTVTINSGYRSPSHNKKVGGATNSQHTKGTAADITVKKDGKVVSGKLVCCLCQSLGFRGIGYISESSVHVDMRSSGSYRGDERKGYSGNVGNNFYTYFGIRQSQIDSLKVKEKGEVKMENKASTWAKESWAKAMAAGITDGSRPQDAATREEVVVILDRLGLIK